MKNLIQPIVVKGNVKSKWCKGTFKQILQLLTKGTALEGSRLGLGAVEYM